MKTALITPIPDLEHFAFGSVHLVLGQYAYDEEFGARYLDFYAERSHRGDYIILDNGADEGGNSHLDLEQLLALAAYVNADEVVLPDYQQQGARSVYAVIEALAWLRTARGRKCFEAAGEPRLMIVPQGRSYEEWSSSWRRMRSEVKTFNADRQYTVGLAKNHSKFFSLADALKQLRRDRFDAQQIDVHLLGWPKWNPEVLPLISEDFPWVRSIDSAKPLQLAKHGIPLDDWDVFEVYGRPDTFMVEPIPTDFYELARYNILAFEGLAGDRAMKDVTHGREA